MHSNVADHTLSYKHQPKDQITEENGDVEIIYIQV